MYPLGSIRISAMDISQLMKNMKTVTTNKSAIAAADVLIQ